MFDVIANRFSASRCVVWAHEPRLVFGSEVAPQLVATIDAPERFPCGQACEPRHLDAFHFLAALRALHGVLLSSGRFLGCLLGQ